MTDTTRGALHPMQLWQLRQPIDPSRVMAAQGHSHLSQQDVIAHLSRIFGFGNFDTEIIDLTCVYEDRFEDSKAKGKWRYEVCYKAMVRLTIRNMDGEVVSVYEDVSTDTAQNQKTRGDAHDLAAKSAVSLAKKRCTIHLGDQFGLSLYNKGQTDPLVIQPGQVTLPEYITQQREGDKTPETAGPNMQEGIPQQVDLGNIDPESAPSEPVVSADQIQQNLNRAGGQS